MNSRTESEDLCLYAVGDVAPCRPDPDTLFTHVGGTLRAGDIVFCQLEINLTERGTRLPQARHTARAFPATAHALRRAGFNVVSFAGNHCMDWGREGFFDTIEALRAADLAVVGVGANLAEARRPVFIERKGTRVAILAYSSILPMSYWAEENRPGCAPLRAHTIYEQIEHDQPGTPARVHTFAHREDLAALLHDVQQARARADVVVLSMHWGIHFVPSVIADYQREVAYAAIDAGADLILGHHAHILKGVEIYRGKPIFYSLCNFAVDLPMDAAHAASRGFREIQKLHPNWEPDFESSYNFPADSRRTVVVKCTIAGGALRRTVVLPAYVSRQSQPEILPPSDPRFTEVTDYLEQMTREAGLNGRLRRDGHEVAIE